MKVSSLHRIYIHDAITTSNIITLYKDQFHYLINVLRLKDKSYIRIFNEKSGEYLASVRSITKKSCDLLPLELLRKVDIPKKLYLIQSIIKNDKMSQIIDMATQIGVTAIIPIISDRTQSKTINYDRYRKCIIESTEQSERITPPLIYDIKTIENFHHEINIDRIFYANEMEDSNNLITSNLVQGAENIALVIGPEGGFTDREIALLSKLHNSYSISLGSNVLRSETASIVLAAQIQLLRD